LIFVLLPCPEQKEEQNPAPPVITVSWVHTVCINCKED